MRKIFKYPLDDMSLKECPSQDILLPLVEILCIKILQNKSMMYCVVDETVPIVNLNVSVYGNGQQLSETNCGNYIDSVIDGSFVWHFFAKTDYIETEQTT